MKTIEEFVKEAEELKYCYYFDENRKVEPEHFYCYQFEWLTILKPNIEDDYTIECDSIEEMINKRLEDGTCLRDYLENHGEFPDYITF